MARKSRRKFSAEFKLDTVIEGLRGEKSIAQICRERDISDSLYHKWKALFQEQAVGDLPGSPVIRRGRPGTPGRGVRAAGGAADDGKRNLKKARTWLDTPSGRNGQ